MWRTDAPRNARCSIGRAKGTMVKLRTKSNARVGKMLENQQPLSHEPCVKIDREKTLGRDGSLLPFIDYTVHTTWYFLRVYYLQYSFIGATRDYTVSAFVIAPRGAGVRSLLGFTARIFQCAYLPVRRESLSKQCCRNAIAHGTRRSNISHQNPRRSTLPGGPKKTSTSRSAGLRAGSSRIWSAARI